MDNRILSGRQAALLTDFYELTMMAGYHHHGMNRQHAVFEYFFRELPHHTGFAVFAGLEDLLQDMESLSFDDSSIDWLGSLGVFEEDFLRWLSDFRFSCDVWAVPEGTVVFPDVPLLRVRGPIGQAQLLETLILNRLNYQTLIATKAARVCFAAEGDPVIDFGLRRAQGPDGGVSGSRAAYIGGCVGTSNVLAGKIYGIPVKGTMAHSWVMSFSTEEEAFRSYLEVFPHNPILLVDTYDTADAGIPAAVNVFKEWRDKGWKERPGIRLDSGDLAYLSKLAWKKLAEAGFADPMIVASNALDEDLIADLKRQGARINAWGVGTRLITGGEEPALGGVYKLAAIEKDGVLLSRMKVSSNRDKTTDPGVKVPVRFFSSEGNPAGDVLFEDGEWPLTADTPVRSHDRVEYGRVHVYPAGTECRPLLVPVFQDGIRACAPRTTEEIRTFAQHQIETLRPEQRRLRNPDRYWVGLSQQLADFKTQEMLRLSNGSREGKM